jgi:hypothetical protein
MMTTKISRKSERSLEAKRFICIRREKVNRQDAKF